MTGTTETRSRSGPAVRAPTYVIVPAEVAYAPVSDALMVTMTRILGICWRKGYRRSPPLTHEELTRLLDRPRTTLQRHLELLEQELGWLRRERQGSRWVLHPLPPFASPDSRNGEASGSGQDELHGTAVAVKDGDAREDQGHGTAVAVRDRERGEEPGRGTAVAVKDRERGEEPGHGASVAVEDRRPSPEHGRRSRQEVLAARQDLIQALAAVGIENPAREQIALDPRVKVDWIAAWQLWAEHPDRASLSNLPGYIVQCLRHRERPPEQYLRLVRLTPGETAQLARSRWDGGPELDPDLRALRPLYLEHWGKRR